ncbi:MAG: hypothetical protein ACI9LV_000424 [Candidatus Nanohaloarchaea archaeon]|jgi:hypothetical protein
MFREALEYPTKSDDAVREYGIAILLTFGSIFVIPFFMLLGYYTKAIRQTPEGEENIPVFTDFVDLMVDGFKFFGIMISYILAPIILISVPEMVGLTGSIGTAGEVFGLLLLLAALYMMPSALVNFARNDQVRSGFNLKEVGGKAFRPVYFKGFLMLIGALMLISIAQITVMLVLFFTIIGIPALLIAMPAMRFYENLVYSRIIAEMAE